MPTVTELPAIRYRLHWPTRPCLWDALRLAPDPGEAEQWRSSTPAGGPDDIRSTRQGPSARRWTLHCLQQGRSWKTAPEV